MTAVINSTHSDPEAAALATCYRLLLQKARERRERLAAETAVTQNQTTDGQCVGRNQHEDLSGES